MTLSGLERRKGRLYVSDRRQSGRYFRFKSSGHGWYGKKASFLCTGSGTDAASGSLCHCSTAPGTALFFVCGNVVSGGRKKDDAAANAVSGLVLAELLIVLAVFPALYPFLLSGIYFFTLLHGVAWILADRMDYREGPATEKQDR